VIFLRRGYHLVPCKINTDAALKFKNPRTLSRYFSKLKDQFRWFDYISRMPQ